jgi:hypothetical protein
VSWSSRPPERSRRAIACRKVVVLLSAAPIPPPSGKQGEKLAVTWEGLTNGRFRGWMSYTNFTNNCYISTLAIFTATGNYCIYELMYKYIYIWLHVKNNNGSNNRMLKTGTPLVT